MLEQEHIHGGDPERELKRLGLEPRNVLDFSINVSPLGVPPEIRAIWNELFREVNRYPTIDGRGVVHYYERRFGLDPDQVLAGNGSTELIYLTPRALGLRRVAVVTPSFHDYTRASRAAGAELLPVPLDAEAGFAPPEFSVLEKAFARGDALFIGNPNNPTGTVFPRQILLDLASAFPHKWLLVDEAFVQFLDNPQAFTLINQKQPAMNILVFHSLTKFFALAGLRLGVAIGHPDVLSRLRPLKEPWSVNRVAEMAAFHLTGCGEYEERLCRLIGRERPRVFNRLQDMPGFEAYRPSANFLLARWRCTAELDDLLHFLLKSGIYLRDCRNFPGLENSFFRMAIRLPEENNHLLSVLHSSSARYL
ncbi:MAG: threonine-phosphate decarboxylase CobD [Syntrophobacteria bacterium]